MTATALAKHATPLRDVFERYHVGWETGNPDLIASLRRTPSSISMTGPTCDRSGPSSPV
jgi:hypothetical protein